MAMNDPIADLLTRIRNALAAEHRYVDLGWSKIKEAIIHILKEEGFISDYRIQKNGSIGVIRILLKYQANRQPVIHGLKRVSKPGLRQYVQKDAIPQILGGIGISILTTPKGLLTGANARKEGVGGELICHVW